MTPETYQGIDRTVARRWPGSRSLASFYGTDNRYYLGSTLEEAIDVVNSAPARLPEIPTTNLGFGSIIKGVIGGLNPVTGGVLVGQEILKKVTQGSTASGSLFGIDFANIAKSVTLALIGGAILIIGFNVLSYEGFQFVRGTEAGKAAERLYTRGLSEGKKKKEDVNAQK